MEEKHEIIILSVSAKQELSAKAKRSQPYLAAKMTINGVELSIFKESNSSLVIELAKVMVRYVH